MIACGIVFELVFSIGPILGLHSMSLHLSTTGELLVRLVASKATAWANTRKTPHLKARSSFKTVITLHSRAKAVARHLKNKRNYKKLKLISLFSSNICCHNIQLTLRQSKARKIKLCEVSRIKMKPKISDIIRGRFAWGHQKNGKTVQRACGRPAEREIEVAPNGARNKKWSC